MRFPATEPDDQPACLQRNIATFTSFSVREEPRVVTGQLVAACAPAHTASSIRRFLTEKNIAVLEQPPYSPDLTSCDFVFFPKLTGVIKGIRLEDVIA